MTTVAADTEKLGPALGKIICGVYVLTTGQGTSKQGLLASWVMQAGFEPPAVTVALQHDREILKQLPVGATFTLNVVNENNTDIMKRFARYQPGQFDGLTLTETPAGAVLTDSVAQLTCTVKAHFQGGDHTLVYAEVNAGDVLHPNQAPWVHLRKNGFSY